MITARKPRYMKPHLILIMSLFILFGTGCAQNKENAPQAACIQPCATHLESDKDISGKLAAKLETFKVDASAEAKYKNTLKSDFKELSDANAAMCLGLRAIDCYKKNGVIDQATAQMLAVETLRFYRSKNGISGGGRNLTPYEKDLIRKSPEGQLI